MLYNEKQIALKTADKIDDLLSSLFDRKMQEIYEDNADKIKQEKVEISIFDRYDILTDFYAEMHRLIRLETINLSFEPVEDEFENLDEKGVNNMSETVQIDRLKQLKEFIEKRNDITLKRWKMFKDSKQYYIADEALNESMTLDMIMWYLTDENFRRNMNELFEISD